LLWLFVYPEAVKPKPFKQVPVWLACGVVLLACILAWLRLDFFERAEALTYDHRARVALHFPAPVSTNLGFVYIDEASIIKVRDGSLPYKFGLYWPRQVYGRIVAELAEQGVQSVGFDVLFGEPRNDHPLVQMADGGYMESDEFFGTRMRMAGNVILAITPDLVPPPIFLTNAHALGDISTDKDEDGILRRALAFRTYRKWHRAFLQLEADPEYGVDLNRARVEAGRVVLPRRNQDPIVFPLDSNGDFDLADFVGDKLPAGMARKNKPFTEERVWHMGIVLAAQGLGIDLGKSEVDLARGRIVLHGERGLRREIPVDEHGSFYIDWCIPPDHAALFRTPAYWLLEQDRDRSKGETNSLSSPWRGKLAVVGSSALANDLTDRGPTPLRKDTLLVSKHWNVANSVIMGRFVHRLSIGWECLFILLMGSASALITWRLRAQLGLALFLGLGAAYVAAAYAAYVVWRVWLPIFLPLACAYLVNYVCLNVWRVVFEEAERRRVRSIFSKVVSPKIVNELLAQETLSLVGTRREITVFFADVRGFTELTDTSHERVSEYVSRRGLTGAEAEAAYDEQARETLKTVNQYLGLIADIIIRQDGTLDKFIGDCVMAFWGAPTPNPKHALQCVRAAIEAQRAIYELNQQRTRENQQREIENQQRAASGLEPLPLFPVLSLGSGINTGVAIAGLMGSAEETRNYTVFGREVNLASRLEGASGRGRIFISETTYQHLKRDDPGLAAACTPLEPIKMKGFRTAVPVYEVPWLPTPLPGGQNTESSPPPAGTQAMQTGL
jgi:class 3 adenylate cyclase/CHASE2 domain-containing sensor protein